MKMFAVYRHPALGHEAVKQGFSWPAFFFGWIWAFVKGLWLPGAVLMFAPFLLVALDPSGILFFVFGLSAPLVLGFQGNAWRVSNLVRRGYEFVQNIEAENADTALARTRTHTDGASGAL